ncbi:MAG: NRDE family protein [Alphaproteobacteria bacterium]|nr:NRDE family protein [Alphaproteobacteria bacterium]
MCTLVILRRPAHHWPVILGANRDEMLARPWRPPARHWPDRPETVGGLDALARGSWLAVNDYGVVAGILNRFGTLGPQEGRRSRGELVLEALDHADANAAAAALAMIEPRSYRPFNLIIADNRHAFWLRHADPIGVLPLGIRPLPVGLSMIASGDLDDDDNPRIRFYRPRFRAAPAPDPESGEWRAWEELLGDAEGDPAAGARGGMNFVQADGFGADGFGTVSSALIALPAPGRAKRPRFRFAARRPAPGAWEEIAV